MSERYRNPHFHGYHGTSPSPILAVLGALVRGVVLLLVMLALTHAYTVAGPRWQICLRLTGRGSDLLARSQ